MYLILHAVDDSPMVSVGTLTIDHGGQPTIEETYPENAKGIVGVNLHTQAALAHSVLITKPTNGRMVWKWPLYRRLGY